MPRPAAAGLADQPLDVQRDRVLAAWDGFRAVAARADLTRPSRLPGWSGHDVCVHIGDWDGAGTMDGLLAAARDGTVTGPDTDAGNAAAVAAHRDASRADVLAALDRARDRIAGWLAAPDAADGPRALGHAPTVSVVGVLPLLTVLSASGYELAVHALDLGDPAPPPALLDAGLAALVDVTGVFAHRRGLTTALTAWTGTAGWQVRADAGGWTTTPVAGRRPAGAAVEGAAAVLLDASAGRRAVPALLAGRAMKVHGLPELVRLAPIVEDVPGLPGGPALKAAGRWMGGAGRLLSLPRLGR
jgi:hypothetical protein